jgi:uncharacterized phage infection (PIP) family protein YhgE
METLKKIWSWIVANKKITIPIAAAIILFIAGMIFGSKIKGCIDKISDPPVVEEVK